jgi:hypothetical protein
LKFFKVYNYTDGTAKTIFFVGNRDTPLEALRIEPETDVAVNPENVLDRGLLQAKVEL